MNPMTGFTVPQPQPYVLAKRIPEDLPYVVHPRFSSVLARLGLPYFLLIVLSACGLFGGKHGPEAAIAWPRAGSSSASWLQPSASSALLLPAESAS